MTTTERPPSTRDMEGHLLRLSLRGQVEAVELVESRTTDPAKLARLVEIERELWDAIATHDRVGHDLLDKQAADRLR